MPPLFQNLRWAFTATLLLLSAVPCLAEKGVDWKAIGLKGEFVGGTPVIDSRDSLFVHNDAVHVSSAEFTGPYRLSGGGVWTRLNTNLSMNGVVGIGEAGGAKLIVGSGGTAAYRSLNGVSWFSVPPPTSIRRVGASAFAHAGAFYFAGGYLVTGGAIQTFTPVRELHRTTDGLAWTRLGNLPFDATTTGYIFSNGSEIVALELVGQSSFRIWTSPDGESWFMEPTPAPFPARDGARIFRLNGRFWLTGGWAARALGDPSIPGPASLSDCWKSADGVHWEPAPDVDASKFPSPNAIVVAGGRAYASDHVGSAQLTRDNSSLGMASLWSSNDLKSWFLEYQSGQAPSLQAILPLGGVLWGFPPTISADFPDIYRSVDGVRWERVRTNFPGRADYACAVHGGRLWISGGYAPPPIYGDPSNDVWSSSDGKNWVRIAASAAFERRYQHAMISFNGKLFLLGGRGAWTGSIEPPPFGDVWNTTDGVAWTRLRSTAFPGRAPGVAIVFKGRLHVIGGNHFDAPLADAYSTPDGVQWDYMGQAYGAEGRFRQAAYQHGDMLYVAGGLGAGPPWWGGSSDIRHSADGTNWALTTDNASFGRLARACVVPFGDNLLLVGKGPHGTFREIWLSGTGTHPFADPGILDFGEVAMTSASSRTTRIVNFEPLAFDALGLLAPEITGEDAGEFAITSSDAPTSIAPGGEAAIAVEYRPTRQGRAEAVLSVGTDDAQHPAVNVGLLGRGGVSSASPGLWQMYD